MRVIWTVVSFPLIAMTFASPMVIVCTPSLRPVTGCTMSPTGRKRSRRSPMLRSSVERNRTYAVSYVANMSFSSNDASSVPALRSSSCDTRPLSRTDRTPGGLNASFPLIDTAVLA